MTIIITFTRPFGSVRLLVAANVYLVALWSARLALNGKASESQSAWRVQMANQSQSRGSLVLSPLVPSAETEQLDDELEGVGSAKGAMLW